MEEAAENLEQIVHPSVEGERIEGSWRSAAGRSGALGHACPAVAGGDWSGSKSFLCSEMSSDTWKRQGTRSLVRGVVEDHSVLQFGAGFSESQIPASGRSGAAGRSLSTTLYRGDAWGLLPFCLQEINSPKERQVLLSYLALGRGETEGSTECPKEGG